MSPIGEKGNRSRPTPLNIAHGQKSTVIFSERARRRKIGRGSILGKGRCLLRQHSCVHWPEKLSFHSAWAHPKKQANILSVTIFRIISDKFLRMERACELIYGTCIHFFFFLTSLVNLNIFNLKCAPVVLFVAKYLV